MSNQKRKTTTSVTARVTVTGFHRWRDAISPVDFLQANHRHRFTIDATWIVSHGDRDQEFFLLQNQIYNWLSRYPRSEMGYEFGGKSCEHLADEALHLMDCQSVTISEDDENRSTVSVIGEDL